MNKLIVVSVAGIAFASGAVNAEDGFSAGASVGNVQLEVDGVGEDFDGNDFGWKLFGAYQFNDYFAVEGGYIDLGEPDDSIAGTNVDIEMYGLQAYAVGIYPASANFDLFGKLGVFSWDVEVEGNVVTLEAATSDGTDLALGIGGRYKLNERFGIRGEFEWFDVGGGLEADTVWMLSIGGEIRFK